MLALPVAPVDARDPWALQAHLTLSPEVRTAIALESLRYGRQVEVAFVGQFDEARGQVTRVRAVTWGSDTRAFFAAEDLAADGLQFLLHTHPHGDLTPSADDLETALRFAAPRGIGFASVSDDGERLHIVRMPESVTTMAARLGGARPPYRVCRLGPLLILMRRRR